MADAILHLDQVRSAGFRGAGSWMLELVHQHAPKAELGFCDGVDLDFDGCIEDLAQAIHADVIVGSASWDPGYGFGLVDAEAALKSGAN